MMSKKMYEKTKEIRGYMTKLGKPHGPYLDWTDNPLLTKEENATCGLAWRRYVGGRVLPSLKTSIKIKELYDRVFPAPK